ncbi:1-acyl-sn-glycerol-3-phosphate acyltransferase [bioreactor metagenome]|uniref:1-acyl-sn-glycerol-3-phosphate acyltransferase n=1 Tax=bioreactor metagenome TaxID=1076179 RepID=A0A645A2I1_9ZZZZ|nr:lysophospholipid acyltransferase family protein [Christensenella sp.]
MLYLLLKILITPFFWLIYRPKVKNLGRLFFRGKAIFISNHFSLGDPIRLAFVAPRPIHFMAKQELFDSKFKRFFLTQLLAFPVYRKQADMLSLKQAMAVLDKNHIFGIFPEGRRSLTGELDSFEKGAAFLAIRCNAPIIPIYADPYWKKRGQIRMIVGETIHPGEVAKSFAGRGVDAVTDAIRDALQLLKNELELMP